MLELPVAAAGGDKHRARLLTGAAGQLGQALRQLLEAVA